MTDTIIMGQFADDAYSNDVTVGHTFDYAPNYTVIATSHGNWSGHDGFATFNAGECKVVVANAGTNPWSVADILADANLALRGGNVQVNDSIALTKIATTAAT